MSSKANREEDEDCLFLERVLDSLYDFGSGPKKMLKMKKKKKRKLEEEEEECPPVKSTCSSSEDYGGHVSSENKQQLKTEQTGPTPPQVNQVEVVTFQDPRKKQKLKQNTTQNKTPAPKTAELKQNKQEELSLEQARLEVHRFGITGYKKEQQRVFEQDRAVMLGARPPKKDFVNYKELQQQIKEKKQKEKEEVQPDKKKKKKSNHRDIKKSSGPGSAPSGQVGRFKNGMLVLNPKDIQKIKGKK